MSTSKNILILGGTGLIGEHISSAILSSRQHFSRIALFTSANTLFTKSSFVDGLRAQNVEIIVGDIKLADDVREAFAGFDTVISCVGRQVISAQLELIRIADKHPDVKRFFPSGACRISSFHSCLSTQTPTLAVALAPGCRGRDELRSRNPASG